MKVRDDGDREDNRVDVEKKKDNLKNHKVIMIQLN